MFAVYRSLRLPVLAAVLSAAVLFHACCPAPEVVPVVLDLPAGDWEGRADISAWRIIYPGSAAAGIPVYQSCIVVSGSAPLLNIARGINLPVLACPVFTTGCGIHLTEGTMVESGFPAGAIYPSDISSGRLILSVESGYACELLRTCSQGSDVYRGLDARRFRALLREKADESSDGDIWSLDPEPMLCRLGYGMFRESAVKAAERMDFEVPVEGDCFVSDNPLLPPALSEDGLLKVSVPIRRKTVFFSTSCLSAPAAEIEIVEVYFDERSWCWLNRATGASEFGRM